MNFDDCPVQDLTDIEKVVLNVIECMEKNIKELKINDKKEKYITNRVLIMRKFSQFMSMRLLSVISNKFNKNLDKEELEFHLLKMQGYVNGAFLEIQKELLKEESIC